MKYEEEQVIGSVETSGRNPSLVSPCRTACPVKPRTAQNVAIALVLGLMAGVFLAFFIEYWRSSAPRDLRTPGRTGQLNQSITANFNKQMNIYACF